MKVINSKDMKGLLEDKSDLGDLFDDENLSGPCWEAKVDRKHGRLVFLIDREEVFSKPLSKISPDQITLENLVKYIALLKEGEIDRLKKEF